MVTYNDINRIYEIIDSQETRLRMVEERGIKSDGIIERCAESIERGTIREAENYKELSNTMNLVNSSMIDIQMTLKDVHNENKNNRQNIKLVDEKVDEINFKVDKVSEQVKIDNEKNKIDLRDINKDVNTKGLTGIQSKMWMIGGCVFIGSVLISAFLLYNKFSEAINAIPK